MLWRDWHPGFNGARKHTQKQSDSFDNLPVRVLSVCVDLMVQATEIEIVIFPMCRRFIMLLPRVRLC
jgi:hypothetical protein